MTTVRVKPRESSGAMVDIPRSGRRDGRGHLEHVEGDKVGRWSA